MSGKGWKCPGCGCCYSPFVMKCFSCTGTPYLYGIGSQPWQAWEPDQKETTSGQLDVKPAPNIRVIQ